MHKQITAQDVKAALKMYAVEGEATMQSRFFKTGEGEYGQGDIFWGIKVPVTRSVAKECRELPLSEIVPLIIDPVHEVRACGFMILVDRFSRSKDQQVRKELTDFYLRYARCANNWDLVDLSAPKILGEWLKDKDRGLLDQLAGSDNLWEQRIAIVSTWTLIRSGSYDDTLRLAEILIDHPHDLIRKAVGWMLREVGKKDRSVLLAFLERNSTRLSRVSLRYAIEHLPPVQRQYYMTKK